jgi:hypothetical protein
MECWIVQLDCDALYDKWTTTSNRSKLGLALIILE